MHLSTHPDTIRPDHGAAPHLATTSGLESGAIAQRMAIVILRQAGDGQATEMRHFAEAEETATLTGDQIAANLAAARRIADRRVIRQDAIIAGAPPPATDPAIHEGTDEQLIEIGIAATGQMMSDAQIVSALLAEGLRPAAISRIWDRLTVRLAAQVAQTPRPSLGSLARTGAV